MTFTPEPICSDSWPTIHALLRPALDHDGEGSVADLIDDLLANRSQLWVQRTKGGDPISAAVTQRFGPVLHCHLLGGAGLPEVADDLIASTAASARPVGIEMFTIQGRAGWERVLGARGWRKKAVIMEADL